MTREAAPPLPAIRRSWLRRMSPVVIGLFLGYIVLVGLLSFLEASLIFPAPKYPVGDWGPRALNQEEVYFAADDGVKLHGWYVAPPNPRAYVLFCHGNGENVAFAAEYLQYLRDELNVAVFAFDYRGYGRSEGSPSERGVLADGRAAQAWLAKRANLAPGDVVLWGRSLGGAVAVNLAAENGARGLIVERTFTSLPDVAACHYAWAPVRLLMRTRLDALGCIERYRGPLLQSHGTADSIVPLTLGRQLFEAHRGPKEFLSLDGHDHNDPPCDEWHAAIHRFLDQIAAAEVKLAR